jgi:hypothetical protein
MDIEHLRAKPTLSLQRETNYNNYCVLRPALKARINYMYSTCEAQYETQMDGRRGMHENSRLHG